MRPLALIICVFSSLTSYAQQEWTLNQCIQQALAHRPEVKLANVSQEETKENLEIARKNWLPTVSSSFSQGGSLGRNIDPFSNDVVTNGITYNSIGINASMNLYDGGANKLEIRRQNDLMKISRLDAEIAQRSLKREVISSFFEAFLAQSQVEIAKESLKNLELQKSVIVELIKEGLRAPSDLKEIELLILQEKLSLKKAGNSFVLAKERLATSILSESSKIQKLNYQKVKVNSNGRPNKRFESIPEFQKQMLERNMIRINNSKIKATTLPHVNFNFNTGTSYSSAAPDEFTLGRQLNYNFGQYASIGISFPIFNKDQLSHKMELNRLSELKAEYSSELARNAFQSEVNELNLSLNQNLEFSQSLNEQLILANEILSNQNQKYKEGLITILELENWRKKMVDLKFAVLQNDIQKMMLLEQLELY